MTDPSQIGQGPLQIGEFVAGTSPIEGAPTGPPYPPPAGAGSNIIGKFQIGVSPIGTIPSFDVWSTIIAQYANSPKIDTMATSFASAVDITELLDEFYDLVLNVDTAQGYGLDVWGRIVGINRVVQVQVGSWFGFAESLPGAYTFGQGPFYSGIGLTNNYTLSDEAYRRVILAKAAFNITDGSIPSINAIMMALFPARGNCYVTEGQVLSAWFGFKESVNAAGFNQAPFYSGQTITTMTMNYTFQFPLTALDYAIISSGVLPKSTGVKAQIVIL